MQCRSRSDRAQPPVTCWRLSTLVQGEPGAILLCSSSSRASGPVRQALPATQVADDARHNEVLRAHPTSGSTATSIRSAATSRNIDTLLGTSSWHLKTIGLQLVAETFAVSLFRMLAESSKDAVLRQVCRRILQDEARHMGFAMLSLPEIVGQASEAERREMEDFAVWALSRTLGGIFPLGAYQDMGFGKAEVDEIKQFRRERAAGGDETAFRKYFRRDLHDGLVRNLRKVGLLTERITPSLQSFGIKLAA